MDHMTAKVSCFARAYHYRNNRTHIFADPIAEKLLGDDYDQIAENMTNGLHFFLPEFKGTKGDGLRLIVDKQLSPSVLGRSAFCESKWKDEIADDCKQYVIFAAGYDTFSLRNNDNARTVFELDYPQMISDKIERIKSAHMKSSAVYVPCDLAETTWKTQLSEAGYNGDQKAFGCLLGISYYLSKAEFEKLLMNICEIMAAGSAICFDYPDADEGVETKMNQMLADGAGEQMKAVYTCAEMKQLLQKCGFELREHLNSEEMTGTYFRDYNQANPKHKMQAPDGVGYVYAVK